MNKTATANKKHYEKVMMLSKRRGFIWGPSPEIFGGLSGFYSYGPLGKIIKNNVEELIQKWLWINGFWEVDAPTVSPEIVWISSGHVEGFIDPIVRCTKCKTVYRADKLIEEFAPNIHTSGKSFEELTKIIEEKNIQCPKCGGKLGEVTGYNLMMKTTIGLDTTGYLRPETATTTYIMFKRLHAFFREKLPSKVFQIGKAYRNEISPRQGVLRLREFTQGEAQTFILPEQEHDFADFKKIENEKLPLLPYKIQMEDREDIQNISLREAIDLGYLEKEAYAWHIWVAYKIYEMLGIPKKRFRLRQHLPDERAHYAKDAWDIEFLTQDFGWVELCGVHDRGDYDLSRHQKYSKQKMLVRSSKGKEVPHVLEIAFGIDRTIYALLEANYVKDDVREWLRLPAFIAPIQIAVFPLMKKDGLDAKAKEVYRTLRQTEFRVVYDEDGSIGKRYRRMDEVGTPFEVTIDYQTLEDGTVTIRDRDTMEQHRVKIEELTKEFKKLIQNPLENLAKQMI